MTVTILNLENAQMCEMDEMKKTGLTARWKDVETFIQCICD